MLNNTKTHKHKNTKTHFLEGHSAAPLQRLLKNCFQRLLNTSLSGKQFRCTPAAFAQLRLLWKAIVLHPCSVCSNTRKYKNTKAQTHKNTHKHKNSVLSFSRTPFRCSPLAFAQTQPLWTQKPTNTNKHSKNTETHKTHKNTVLSLSRRPFRCSQAAFAQTQPLWKAISLQPSSVCSNTASL